MRLTEKKVRFGGTGQPFDQGNFWAYGDLAVTGYNSDREGIDNDFDYYADGLLKSNAVVFASYQTRMFVLSEARFQFQKMRNGRPDALFGNGDLSLLERPWPGGDTSDLINIMDLHAFVAGNWYGTLADDDGNLGNAARGKSSTRIATLRPDRVQIIINSRSGNPHGADAKVVGYLYSPILPDNEKQTVLLMPDEVAHYAPNLDPMARFRGMSCLTPVVREVMADSAARDHKLNFFKQGATLGHVVRFAEGTGRDDFNFFVEKYKASHQGFQNAYKTLFLGGGADVTTVQADLKQIDFTQTVGHGETRIAACTGVPPVIVGLSEGLQAATYSNYGQARRRLADGTLRPLWRMMSTCLERLVVPPSDARLWYDDRDIAFLRDDRKEEAEVMKLNAETANAYVAAGYDPDSVVTYLVSRNPEDLKHTGLVSVQLLPPGTVAEPPPKAGGEEEGKKPENNASDKAPKSPKGGSASGN